MRTAESAQAAKNAKLEVLMNRRLKRLLSLKWPTLISNTGRIV
jgi:hypothetical protein